MSLSFLHGPRANLIPLALVALSSCAWHVRLVRLAFASRSWPAVPGRLLRAEFVEGSRGWGGSANVSYAYEVSARKLTGSRVRFGPLWGSGSLTASWDVDDYRGVRDLTVYYDPDEPSRSVLEPGPMPGLWIAVVASAVAAAVVCWLIATA